MIVSAVEKPLSFAGMNVSAMEMNAFDEGNKCVRFEEGYGRAAESSVGVGKDYFRFSNNPFQRKSNHFRDGNNYR